MQLLQSIYFLKLAKLFIARQMPDGKPAIKLNFSKTNQFGTGEILAISQELFDLLEKM
tara:strand:- start:128 stop:301 length:174 start_codon:yes stop_codon:yes gene_type:complete